MELEAVDVVVGLDGVELDEVRWGAVGWDPEDLEVGLADGWLDWLAGQPAEESGEHCSSR